MFNDTFYPTPPHIIAKMLEPYNTFESKKYFSEMCILEPSAGKGDIIDFINNKLKYSSNYGRGRKKRNLYAIEINPDLQTILQAKDCKIIGSDFLNTVIPYDFDLIVMNPPFNEGAKHLLRAWEVIKNGDIVCLLNEETVKNPYTKERQLLKHIIDEHGTIEFLGDCFSKSERKTGVNVALVRLTKKAAKKDLFDDVNLNKEYYDFPKDIPNNQPAVYDRLTAYEHRYNATIAAYKASFEAFQQFAQYGELFYSTYHYSRVDSSNTVLNSLYTGDFNAFVEDLNTQAWNKVLEESKFKDHLTTSVRNEFIKKFQQQSNFAFTKANMIQLLEILFVNKEAILLQCIEEVFDNMTRYDKKNKVYIEGWKTNDAWRVNKKVILPRFIKISWGRFEVDWNYQTQLSDIDRAMCHIKGYKMEGITTIHKALQRAFDTVETLGYNTSRNTFSSTFFKGRFYKKGTLHLEFKDDFVWREFNYLAAKVKGFPLPERQS